MSVTSQTRGTEEAPSRGISNIGYAIDELFSPELYLCPLSGYTARAHWAVLHARLETSMKLLGQLVP